MTKRKFIIITISLLVYSIFFTFFAGQLVKFNKKSQYLKSLSQIVAEEATKLDLKYSLYVKDLSFPPIELAFKENKQFPAASIIKLPILASCLKAVEEEKVFLNQQVTITRKDIAAGSGLLKAKRLPHSLSLGNLLETMIAESDNTATNKVIELLGFDYINQSFKELGLDNTSLSRKMMDFSLRPKGVENYTSSYDIAYLLEKIYRQKLINKELSALALSFLKKQKVNDRLPRYLPKNVIVAHKTGLERSVVHDAGIIFAPKGNYLICVLVRNSPNHKAAKKFIAQISLLAYNHYR